MENKFKYDSNLKMFKLFNESGVLNPKSKLESRDLGYGREVRVEVNPYKKDYTLNFINLIEYVECEEEGYKIEFLWFKNKWVRELLKYNLLIEGYLVSDVEIKNNHFKECYFFGEEEISIYDSVEVKFTTFEEVVNFFNNNTTCDYIKNHILSGMVYSD